MPRLDDELPYEELDPCCQREIDDNRRNMRIKSELRRYDRSNHRLDIQKAVMGNLKVKSSCACCGNVSKDYPLLIALREKSKVGKENLDTSSVEGKDNIGKDNVDEEDQNSDEEEDEFDALLNESITPYEMERLYAVQEMKSKLEFAQSMGYGVHREDTVGHLKEMIDDQERVVCHVFDPSSLSCAHMDIILETLAGKYIGTRFRRISQSSLSRLQSKFPVSISDTCLLCFVNGTLIHSSSIHAFGIETEIYLNDVERFLERTHVLSDELNTPTLQPMVNADERDDDEKYCDEPGCSRKFAHEHVGSGFSLLSSSEALSPNYMQSL